MRLSPEPVTLPVPGRLRRAVFIDKDGTLVENVPYNVDPALLKLTPNAVEGLSKLAGAGYLLIVISNQPGLALGRFGLPALQALERALTARLAEAGVALDGFYICPHAPVDDTAAATARPCRCRKPTPGMILEAARERGIDLDGSWMVGDILDDVEAGWRAGCRSVHLDVGNETVWRRSPIRVPTHTVPDLGAAADAILASAQPLPFAARRTWHGAVGEALGETGATRTVQATQPIQAPSALSGARTAGDASSRVARLPVTCPAPATPDSLALAAGDARPTAPAMSTSTSVVSGALATAAQPLRLLPETGAAER